MKDRIKITMTFQILFFLLITSNSNASCDCKAKDANNACIGNAITLKVIAGNPNGGIATDSIYNWEFNSGGDYAYCGQFANGDYWISPGPGQTSVTITSITSNGSITADINPEIESIGLMNGTNNYGNYDSEENIIPKLPQNFSKATSIVAAVQRSEKTEGSCGTNSICGECVDSYNVVTILPSVPKNAGSDMIRPNISNNNKTLLTFSDFDFTKLPVVNYLNGTDEIGFEKIRQRWAHSTEIFGLVNSLGKTYSEGGRAFRSHILIDDYSAGVARQWNDDMMIIFSDDNEFEQKKAALASMLAYGLDLYDVMYKSASVRYFGVGATQHAGKFMPVVLLAALSRDESYAENVKKTSEHLHDSYFTGPHELAQIHEGLNGPVWGDELSYSAPNRQGSYWGNLLSSRCYDDAPDGTTCNPSLGKKTQKDPYGYIDGPPNKPGTSYMSSTLGVQRSFVASMLLFPKIRDIVNYDQLINYVDRIDKLGVQVLNDPCVTPDSRENPETCDAYRNTGCTYYGVTWGPVNPNDDKSECIKTATPPFNKVGRFTSLSGTKPTPSYTSKQVEENWPVIISLHRKIPIPKNFKSLNGQ